MPTLLDHLIATADGHGRPDWCGAMGREITHYVSASGMRQCFADLAEVLVPADHLRAAP